MRRKIVPNILCSSVNKIVRKESDNVWIYTGFLEDERKEMMVKRRKELHYVEDKDAGWYIFDPSYVDEMS